MSKEILTHSESYVKKTNRIILAVGITSFIIFVFGVVLLIKSNNVVDEYEEPVFTANDDALNITNTSPLTDNIEFDMIDDGEVPITMTPDPISMGQVVLGTEAKNVLTIGTNGKTAIKIDDVDLAEPPFDGFTYEDYCSDEELRGNQTCNITMSWIPVIHGNVQNNFIISWHEANLTKSSAKAAKVSVEGTAISHQEGTSEFNINETGIYQISYQLYGVNNANETFNFNVIILKNGATINETLNSSPVLTDDINNRMTLTSTVILSLNAGDVIQLGGTSLEDILYTDARMDIVKIR